jgi:hypothetical protein
MALFNQDWFVIPAVSILVFVIAYLWSERVLQWLHTRSLGQREEVLRLLELMFVETDVKKVTTMMTVSSFGLGFLVFVALWPNLIAALLDQTSEILTVYFAQSVISRLAKIFGTKIPFCTNILLPYN